MLSPQVQQERDELYRKFSAAILEVQQKTGFQNLLLERKLQALSAAVEKKEAQVSEVLATSNLDPAALTLVSRKLEVGPGRLLGRGPSPRAPTPASSLGSGWGSLVVDRPPARAASVMPVGTLSLGRGSQARVCPPGPPHVLGSAASQRFADPEPMAPAVRWALLSLPGAGPRTSGPELLGPLVADPDTGLGDRCVPRTVHTGH